MIAQAKDFGSAILTGIAEWIAGKVAEELAILAAAAAASGGLSEVIDIARRIYKAILTAVRWARRILDMANEALDNVLDIAGGAIETVGAKFRDILHRGMPVVIGFLADQVGLGGVGEALRNIVDKLRAEVDKGILWLIDKIKAGIEAVIGAARAIGEHDERTDEQKQADLDKAIAEAEVLQRNPKTTEATIKKGLVSIKNKYKMKSLELIVDNKNETKETVHIEGEINPKGKTNTSDIEKIVVPEQLKEEGSQAMAQEAAGGLAPDQVPPILERVKRRLVLLGANDLRAQSKPDGAIAVSFRVNEEYFPLGEFARTFGRGHVPPGRTVKSETRIKLVSNHPITDLYSLLPKDIPAGGIQPNVSAGGRVNVMENEIQLFTWNTSPMEQTGGSHSEPHVPEAVESAKEALKYIESIEMRNFTYSACSSCSDALAGWIRQICSAQREADQIVLKRAEIYWTKLFNPEDYSKADATTWATIETLARSGWTIHAPAKALPDPKSLPGNVLAEQAARRPLSQQIIVIAGTLPC